MATRLRQIFWGLLIVILDISFNGFDLLPDGIGYLLMAAGCYGLASWSPKFLTTQTLCLVLAVLWLIHFAIHGSNAILFNFVRQVTDCAMIWQLLGGIREYTLTKERPDLARRAENRRIAYVAIMVVTFLLTLAMEGSPDASPLAIVLAIAMLITLIMILHLIHRVKTELAIFETGKQAVSDQGDISS
ncbi:hypothetical protein [Gimesia maris]|uniref:Uncharacterized protein n=1 Tax=Gimesia maris TaxID=122 RepID=A0ABX5YHF0_9PLAN|nr:hypothetical protein [Gimesia maris]EDL59553.1 hypothetical protein PM8797T_04340 [Gimesia maris DSM 8797]QEG15098.1 hypothetical protein GmarT_09360 [Gimesia maris]QGQ31553.1 hypothetical protein F1729_24565 [Gimesia maris]|tara:strand:+ start:26550 stop:27113 length:564 start_codon:yes stop_codon:yes gene_type:complete